MNWLPQRTRLLTISTGVLFAMLIVQAIADNFFQLSVTRYMALFGATPSYSWLWQWATWPIALSMPNTIAVLVWLLFFYWIIGGFEARFGERRTVQLLAFVTVALAPFAILLGALNLIPILAGTSFHTLAALTASGWHARGGPRLAFFGQFSLTAEQFLGGIVGFVVLDFILQPSLEVLLLELVAMALGIAFAHYMARGGPRRRKPKKKKRGKSGTNMRAIDGGKSNGRILH